jgi:hypothetical protein
MPPVGRVCAAAYSKQAQENPTRRWISAASTCCVPAPAANQGFQVRRHGRRPRAQSNSERVRISKPSLPGPPDVHAVQGQQCGGGAGRVHNPLPGPNVHPQGQWPAIYSSGPTRLVAGKQHDQIGLSRARIPVEDRLCGVVEGRICDVLLNTDQSPQFPKLNFWLIADAGYIKMFMPY